MRFLLACVYNWLSVRKAAEVKRLDSEFFSVFANVLLIKIDEEDSWSLEEDAGVVEVLR